MFYISFEGIDGSGKSTVLEAVARKFDELNINHIVTKEPKGVFRDIILDPDNRYNLNEKARMFLYQADRAVHSEYLKQFENTNTIVLCDRGLMSTLVYQAITAKVDMYDLMQMSMLACSNRIPDMIIHLHSSVEIARQRINKRNDIKNYFDLKGDSFFREVQTYYEKATAYLQRQYGMDIVDINTDVKTIDEVTDEIVNYLKIVFDKLKKAGIM